LTSAASKRRLAGVAGVAAALVVAGVISALIVHGDGSASPRPLPPAANVPPALEPGGTPGAGADCLLSRDRGAVADASVSDNPSISPAELGATVSTHMFVGSDVQHAFASSAAIAEFRVVGRDLAHERPASSSSDGIVVGDPVDPAATPINSGTHFISRDLRLQTLRTLKGSFPACLEIDIPGGRVNGYRLIDAAYPAVVHVGDTLLVIFGSYPSGRPTPTVVVKVSPDGRATLPYPKASGSGNVVVNVAAWRG